MRRVAVALLLLALASTAQGGPAARSAAAPMRTVVVTLRERADLTGLPHTRKERLRALEAALRDTADSSQASIRRVLADGRTAGTVTAVHPMWIVNAITVTATDDVIADLAARPDVASVRDDPITVRVAGGGSSGPPAPNLLAIHAPDVWALGDRGNGVVVATLDTGADMADPEIAAAWRGGSDSWYDPYGEHASPADISGHGTHVLSVLVAGDASGAPLGVAPGSRWIAARIFDDRGRATTSAIHMAFQWLLDPDGDPGTADAPQVVNNSWTMTAGCNLEFEPDIQALRAANILPVFAAGNSGPSAPSDYSPANNPGALSVGATTSADAASADTSRGPTSCGGTSRTYPSVTAPGVDVPVLDPPLSPTTASGTSLAAPHAAGALALLLSAHPGLTVSQQEAALQSTAVDLGDPGPDNVFGDGRIDALAAYQSLAADTTGPVVTGAGVTGTTLTATATDAASSVAAAEWYVDADPVPGSGTPMAAADGAFDALSEGLSADVAGLAAGGHTIGVRARDAAGNWGAAEEIPVTVGPVTLFADSFASGSISAWSAYTGAGRLSVTSRAALDGDGYGLRVRVAGALPAGVVDVSPAGQTAYAARFLFDPAGTSTSNQPWVILTGWGDHARRVFLVRIRSQAGRFWLRGSALSGAVQLSAPWVRMSDAPHAIELLWRAGTPGSFQLTVDGAPAGALTGLANGPRSLRRVMMGPASGMGPGASGALLFDAFSSQAP
jgi:serine protease AprX